jgi:transposase InsO family protein
VYEAIMEILTPKDEAFFEKYGIKNPIYNAYGIPDLIVFDQAAENHAQRVSSMITRLGISVSFANAGQPQEKANIERFFGVMSYDIGSFQGGTNARIYGTSKRTKESQEEAVFTIEEVNAFLQRWRYDVYHLQGIRRLS